MNSRIVNKLNMRLQIEVNDHQVAAVSEHEFRSRRNKPNYLEALKSEYYYIMSQPEIGSFEHFLRPENSEKNRYFDVTCWDASRVKITPKESNSDYIHANYVDSYEKPKKFIATQGPLKGTVGQFWQMIWEQKSQIIIMLTELGVNDKEKCAPYWNAFGDKQDIFQANEFSIRTILETKKNSGYIMSVFEILNSDTEESRLIFHFRYVDWLDYGAPLESKSFVKLIWDVNNHYSGILSNKGHEPAPGPIIVHCSAGVGRTGTFCAIDSCIYQLAKTGEVSVPKVVMQIRKQRRSSVLSEEQYIFIYTVLYEFSWLFEIFPNVRQFFSKP